MITWQWRDHPELRMIQMAEIAVKISLKYTGVAPLRDSYGTEKWHNEKGQLHREDGPAVLCKDGTEHWLQNGKFHRVGGPSSTYSSGQKIWSQNGKYHRLDGPATILSDGKEFWWVNGKEIDIESILERLDISPDWRNWTDEEKMIVRLALP